MRAVGSRKKYNVRDVARHAGVSVATVSRVLNSPERVSEDKRAKVEATIEALQFVRSSSARAINSGRTHLVGALVPTLDHAIFARFIASIEEELDGHALSLVVATTGYDQDTELNKAQRLLNMGVEGLIVSGVTRAEAFSALIKRYQVHVIATSYFKPNYEFPTIGYDNTRAAHKAWAHLVECGHEHIAVLTSPLRESDRSRARVEGLKEVSAKPLNLFEAELDYASAGAATLEIQRQMPQATAILCLSDVLAQGALLQLAKSGFKVPEDMAVMGIDDLPSSASFDPPLTSVHLPVGQMGRAAGAAMATWIETGHPPVPIEFDPQICVRQSTQSSAQNKS